MKTVIRNVGEIDAHDREALADDEIADMETTILQRADLSRPSECRMDAAAFANQIACHPNGTVFVIFEKSPSRTSQPHSR